MIKEENPPSTTEWHYGPPTVGPDGSSAPGHVYYCLQGWQIGDSDIGVDDTPGATSCPLTLADYYATVDVPAEASFSLGRIDVVALVKEENAPSTRNAVASNSLLFYRSFPVYEGTDALDSEKLLHLDLREVPHPLVVTLILGE